MKTLLIVLFVGLLWVSCSEEVVEPYRGSDNYIHFLNGNKMHLSDAMYTYKGDGTNYEMLVGNNSYKKRDTALFRVSISGFISDQSRVIKLEQYVPATVFEEDGGAEAAVPGVNYVSFDDPEMQKHLIMPADSVAVNIPIIVLSDPNSTSGTKVLYFRLVENENFKIPAAATNLGLHKGRVRIKQNW